jgi:hypothetical protein
VHGTAGRETIALGDAAVFFCGELVLGAAMAPPREPPLLDIGTGVSSGEFSVEQDRQNATENIMLQMNNCFALARFFIAGHSPLRGLKERIGKTPYRVSRHPQWNDTPLCMTRKSKVL